MTIHLRPKIEEELKRVAHERGRDLQAIVDEAFDQYLTASSITAPTDAQRVSNIRTPHLAHSEQAKDFRKQIIKASDASL